MKPSAQAARRRPRTHKHVLSKVTEAMRVAARERDRRGLESTESGEKSSRRDGLAADPARQSARASTARRPRRGRRPRPRGRRRQPGDKSNPDLRTQAVLDGAIAPEQLVLMSPADLATSSPHDLREMRRAREERIGEDAFVSGETGDLRALVKTAKGEEVVKVGGGEELVEVGDGLGNRGGARAESQSQSEPPFRSAEDDEPDEPAPAPRVGKRRRAARPSDVLALLDAEDVHGGQPRRVGESRQDRVRAREGDEGPGPGGRRRRRGGGRGARRDAELPRRSPPTRPRSRTRRASR